jgi:hypothetical protein
MGSQKPTSRKKPAAAKEKQLPTSVEIIRCYGCHTVIHPREDKWIYFHQNYYCTACSLQTLASAIDDLTININDLRGFRNA